MGACGNITMGAAYNCLTPINAGVESRLILVDKTIFDRAAVGFSMTPPTTLIETVVFSLQGDVAYAFEGIRRSNRPQSAFVPQTVSVGYDHQVEFQIFDISQEQKDNIEIMGLSRMVAIVQNTNSAGNGNSVFEIFGKDTGMELQAGPMRVSTDIETNGSYTINLKTSDESGKEPKLPTSWLNTDFATTLPLVDALLVPIP